MCGLLLLDIEGQLYAYTYSYSLDYVFLIFLTEFVKIPDYLFLLYSVLYVLLL